LNEAAPRQQEAEAVAHRGGRAGVVALAARGGQNFG
jgi:hypothetical protein